MFSVLREEIAPRTHQAPRYFSSIGSVNAEYRKHRIQDMCVFYNCFYNTLDSV